MGLKYMTTYSDYEKFTELCLINNQRGISTITKKISVHLFWSSIKLLSVQSMIKCIRIFCNVNALYQIEQLKLKDKNTSGINE